MTPLEKSVKSSKEKIPIILIEYAIMVFVKQTPLYFEDFTVHFAVDVVMVIIYLWVFTFILSLIHLRKIKK